jgi:hypothetical protein
MNKLLPILRRDFPGFETISAFEAGIPAYQVKYLSTQGACPL